MVRLIVLILVGLVFFGGLYMVIFKRGDVNKTLGGYKKAATPQEAADMFKKAIADRDFAIAADYCTKDYAEQLRRGKDAATELGTSLDNLIYQMNERGLLRDETKFILFMLDPFPKDFTVTTAKESGDNAEGTIVFGTPILKGNTLSSGMWQMKPEMFLPYVRSVKYTNDRTIVVPLKKDAKLGWLYDFPADSALQLRVGNLNDKYKNYVNPLKIVTQEVKNDPSTREDATGRLKTLLEQAARE